MSAVDRYYYEYPDDDGQDWYIIFDRNTGDQVATVADRLLCEKIMKMLNYADVH